MGNIVSLIRAEYQNVYDGISGAIALAGPPDLPKGSRVVVKINLCEARTPETGAITHPVFLEALLRYLRNNYEDLKIFVVESDATVVVADEFIRWFGFLPVLEKWNAEWVNISKQKVTSKEIKGRFLKQVPVAEVFENSYFISLAKLKTNALTGFTGCLKNQFGCLPLVEKSIYHPHINDVIADVNLAIHPDYCFIDGIIGMGGAQGPGIGVPVPAKVIVCGRDPVAVDAVGARIIGFNPNLIAHISKAARSGVGSLSYTIKGMSIKDTKINFEINKPEMWLLKFGGRLQRHAQKQLRDAWRS